MSRRTTEAQNAKIKTANVLAELLSAEELDVLVAEALNKAANLALQEQKLQRQRVATQISELLETATKALQKAGELASENQIPFTFHTPKGALEKHSGRWMESACYASDGWYYAQHTNASEVDGQSVDVDWAESFDN